MQQKGENMTTYQTATKQGAFQALLAYARKRPGLDMRDYGGGMDGYLAYQQELRGIQKDFRRVKELTTVAIGLGIGDDAVIEAAKHAFSGRLEWAGDHWEYCTGQYWPTEYRKAVAAVLDQAIHAYKQAHAAEIHKPVFATVSDVRAYHEATGSHWFDRSSMRFFGTRIHTKGLLIAGKYFITSEQPPHGPRGYTVRGVKENGDIETEGELCGYRTAARAAQAARLKSR